MSEGKGVVIPSALVWSVVIALISYGIGGIWWGATVHTTLQSQVAAMKDYREAAENLRQRVAETEGSVRALTANERSFSASITRVENDIRQMRAEMQDGLKQTNDLLRAIMLERSRTEAETQSKRSFQ